MALSSSSTLAEVEAAYDDNADFDTGTGDSAKCDAFVQAVRFLKRRYSQEFSSGNKSRRRDLQQLESALQRALDWKRARQGVMFTRGRPL